MNFFCYSSLLPTNIIFSFIINIMFRTLEIVTESMSVFKHT